MPKIVALAGGVGGSKLIFGLSKSLPPEDLCIVANTGDDEIFHGLYVSPDVDTIVYTLAGLVNKINGWGVEEDTFSALGTLRQLGSNTWFNLGDKDIGLHLWRTEALKAGKKLSQVTEEIAHRFGIMNRIIPMTDSRVQTRVHTDKGVLSFQEYFVENRCEPAVKRLTFKGSKNAAPPETLLSFLEEADAIIFCPSNPLVSIGPILAIRALRESIENFKGPRIAVSPIVNGHTIKGPAAKMMVELGMESSNVQLAKFYMNVCDTFIVDEIDLLDVHAIQALGLQSVAMPIIMKSDEDKLLLAQKILENLAL